MAFNWQIFKTRTLTAIVFAVVMITGLLLNHWSFLILFSIIHFGCWWEYLNLGEKIYSVRYHPYCKLGFMLIGYGIILWSCNSIYQINNYSIRDNLSLPVSAAGFALLIIGIFGKNRIRLKAFGFAALGLLYISFSWGMLVSLYNYEIGTGIEMWYLDGRHKTVWNYVYVFNQPFTIPLLIIVAIWINDTMAYIVGSLIGKTPLSKISPKKTWEGTIGGMLLSVLVTGLIFSTFTSSLVHPQFYDSFSNVHWFAIAAIAAVAGTFGDLLESKLKRMAAVKDSGTFMPGHGGFLDRFDSLLVATFFVFLYIAFIEVIS
ncbi:MAG TPA: phosphatidate cytidylyltransferase [Chitinophagaceae bacterium]